MFLTNVVKTCRYTVLYYPFFLNTLSSKRTYMKLIYSFLFFFLCLLYYKIYDVLVFDARVRSNKTKFRGLGILFELKVKFVS